MSIERGALLGQGRAAGIYAWGDDQVLKLFHGNWPEHAEHEACAARLAHAGGVNTPRVDAIIEVDGRSGIVYECVEGPSMLHALTVQPWRLRSMDLAQTSLLPHLGALPPGMSPWMRLATQALRRMFHAECMRRYLQLSQVTRQQMEAWEAPLAAARTEYGGGEDDHVWLSFIQGGSYHGGNTATD